MSTRPKLEDLLSENWPAFREFKPEADQWLMEAARSMPPEFHRDLRRALLDYFLDQVVEEDAEPLRLRLIVDSGIIVTDSFGVGRGFSSSTPRLLDSPFVRVYAPPEAWEEVPRIIRERHPSTVKVEPSLRHAEVFLNRIRRVETTSPASVQRAADLIGKHSPEDVGFLAVAIETRAHAVISFDKRAYDRQAAVRRWSMKDGSEAVLRYESGTLSLGIAGAAAEIIGRAAEILVASLTIVVVEVIAAVAAIIEWIATKTANSLERVPTWAVAAALVAAAAVTAAYVFIEGFREWVNRGVSKVAAIIGVATERIVAAARAFWVDLKDILLWLWASVVRPVLNAGLLAAGVLLSHIDELIRECESHASAATNDSRSAG
jgi:predicted nucleic acid-binding protein